jgi:hypothetical protein
MPSAWISIVLDFETRVVIRRRRRSLGVLPNCEILKTARVSDRASHCPANVDWERAALTPAAKRTLVPMGAPGGRP